MAHLSFQKGLNKHVLFYFKCSRTSYINIKHLHVSICSVQPEATHQLTSTPLWLMASPSSVLGLPGQSTHWSIGWALSQVNDCVDKIFVVSCHLLKVIPINVFFPPGMTLALFLYMGHIPRIFSKNLLYSQKTRFRVPKGDKGEKKKM